MWEQGVNEMLHKVKVTVIDKKLYPELQEAYCMDPKSEHAPATMWATRSSSNALLARMISGTWAFPPW